MGFFTHISLLKGDKLVLQFYRDSIFIWHPELLPDDLDVRNCSPRDDSRCMKNDYNFQSWCIKRLDKLGEEKVAQFLKDKGLEKPTTDEEKMDLALLLGCTSEDDDYSVKCD